ncbi:MAG TPA: hypothetical protein VKZ85_00205 [Woeseiaceae bacterium]|nr:hypothetical protein [Woeseiaceae bacterium]
MKEAPARRLVTAGGATVEIDTRFEMLEVASLGPSEEPLRAWAAASLGSDLPPPGRAVAVGTLTVMRTAPRRLLVTGEPGTRKPGGPGVTVTRTGDGFVRLACRGPGLRQWLAAYTSLDLRPRSFGAGSVGWTGFLAVRVLLHCLDDASFDVYCPASYGEDLLSQLA